MHILALDAYHGGSHRAFISGWIANSRHRFDLLTLPAYKWKWRMRHAAVTFTDETAARMRAGKTWDAVFCTDMLNLAEFLGLCPPELRRLPTIVYFHENQLTYPNRQSSERDLHFAFTNLTTALAATHVWFNSAFHRDEFLSAVETLIGRMPDNRPVDAVARIRSKSQVHYPGVDQSPIPPSASSGPLQIVWVSRWEHDKDPETFFTALRKLADTGHDFRLSVLGESFANIPVCFEVARREFADRVDHWGYLESPEEYWTALAAADVVVSTAQHEFFGIAVLEAVAAGCFPLVPKRLAYPEVLSDVAGCYHTGTADDLAGRLAELCGKKAAGSLVTGRDQRIDRLIERFGMETFAAEMDREIELTESSAGYDANGRSTDAIADQNFRAEL
jgi:glycosyltransferase involved in cell wall biosynthesis